MFRFAIRDVLWLTVAVGLTLGWSMNRSQLLWTIENEHRHRVDAVQRVLELTAELQKLRATADAENSN